MREASLRESIAKAQEIFRKLPSDWRYITALFGIVIAAILFSAFVTACKRLVRYHSLLKDPMDGFRYEEYCGYYLRSKGYTGVWVTKKSHDHGADIIANRDGTRIAVQCKFYKGKVGQSAVREVIRSMRHYDCKKGMVITNSCFSSGAIDRARRENVELIAHVRPKTHERYPAKTETSYQTKNTTKKNGVKKYT